MGVSGMKMLWSNQHRLPPLNFPLMGKVGIDSQGNDSPGHGQAPAEEEDDLVRVESARGDVAQPVGQQTAEL
jgi:hypothetical protein